MVNRVKSGCEHELYGESDWEQWLGRHVSALLLFARQQTRSEPDAQDVLQESVIDCWSRQPRGQVPPLGSIFATIRRRAIDLARSCDRRQARESASGTEVPQAWFDSAPEERERSRLLQEALMSLPEIYREAVTLKIWGALTFAEIAEALEIPANTAASRYRYGLEQLRKQLKEILA